MIDLRAPPMKHGATEVEFVLRRLAMFKFLRTKLTLLYAALFGVTLILISVAVFSAISSAAQHQVRGELTASGTVFDRVWSLRSSNCARAPPA
uniref:Uncharacterized protein n=1 Tax=Phenylobacterium glaciei TaxID=2803784 RepID=A0A974S9X2_9CAUL|nr:hypothetical protein JKL49_25895 [Phenylobacterium glaciei]